MKRLVYNILELKVKGVVNTTGLTRSTKIPMSQKYQS